MSKRDRNGAADDKPAKHAKTNPPNGSGEHVREPVRDNHGQVTGVVDVESNYGQVAGIWYGGMHQYGTEGQP